MKRYITLYALLISFLAASSLQAEFPSTIKYQGRLVSGAELVNAMVEMHFRLYTEPAGGALLFESTNHVLVVDGLYATEIGEYPVSGTLQEALKNYPVYLEVEVDGVILSPRERFSAVPYALQAAPPSQGQNVSIIDSSGVETFYPCITNAFEHLDSGQTLRLYPGDHYVSALPVWTYSPYEPERAGLFLDNKHNVRIEGIGQPRIYSDTYGDYLFIQHCSNIEIEGITFDGLGPHPNVVPNFAMINFRSTNQNIRILNCRFTNFGRHGISHLNWDKLTTHVLIQGCYFENGGDGPAKGGQGDGAAISGIGANWTVVNNHIVECLRGIEIEGPGTPPQSHIVIANNTLQHMVGHGIMLFATGGISSNYTDISIHNNIISGIPVRPPEYTRMTSALTITGGERISIKGNIIYDWAHGWSTLSIGTGFTDTRDVIVANNQIHETTNRGLQLSQQSGRQLSNVLVTGNMLRRCGIRAMIISGTGHSVLNNIIADGLDKNPAGAQAIEIFVETGTTDNILISGNHAYNNRYGLLIESDVGGNILMGDNFFYNNADFDFLDNR